MIGDLPAGTLLPALSLPSAPDGEPVALRGGRGPRVIFIAHPAGCAGCRRYLGDLAAAGGVGEWGGRLMVVAPGSLDDARALLEAATRGGASPPVRALADPEGKLRARLGLRGAAVVVADEWGEIYSASDAGAGHELPTAEEVVEWVRFVSIQCPECEQPEGGWRTME